MGADLYIKDMERESQICGFEVSVDAVDNGYFRDCYNDSGLFAQLGLSWWETMDMEEFKTNENWEMNVEQLKEFKKYVNNAYLKWLEESKDKDEEYVCEYATWCGLLLRFLDKAISINSPVIFSV